MAIQSGNSPLFGKKSKGSKRKENYLLNLAIFMSYLENSAEGWDSFWKNWLIKFYPKIPFYRPVENFIRYQIYFKAINKLLNSTSLFQKDILELGSGTGSNSLYLAKSHKTKSVTLVDFSQQALTWVKTKSFPCPVIKIQEDIFNFSPKKKYDFVHSSGLIEHFSGKDRLLVIRKHSQFAKHNGLVMIWVPIFSPAFSLIRKFNLLLGIKEIPFSKEELQILCRKSNLEIIKEGKTFFNALYGVLARKKK